MFLELYKQTICSFLCAHDTLIFLSVYCTWCTWEVICHRVLFSSLFTEHEKVPLVFQWFHGI